MVWYYRGVNITAASRHRTLFEQKCELKWHVTLLGCWWYVGMYEPPWKKNHARIYRLMKLNNDGNPR